MVKLENDIPIKILKVDSENNLKLWSFYDLLNKENKEKNISYKVFDIIGEIVQ